MIMKPINTLCGQNVDFLNIEVGGAYSNHWFKWLRAQN